jgi:hypothetical protein
LSGSASIVSGGGAVAGLVGRFAGARLARGLSPRLPCLQRVQGLQELILNRVFSVSCGIVVMAVFKHLTTAQARKQALAECQLFEFLSA